MGLFQSHLQSFCKLLEMLFSSTHATYLAKLAFIAQSPRKQPAVHSNNYRVVTPTASRNNMLIHQCLFHQEWG